MINLSLELHKNTCAPPLVPGVVCRVDCSRVCTFFSKKNKRRRVSSLLRTFPEKKQRTCTSHVWSHDHPPAESYKFWIVFFQDPQNDPPTHRVKRQRLLLHTYSRLHAQAPDTPHPGSLLDSAVPSGFSPVTIPFLPRLLSFSRDVWDLIPGGPK